ncbi:O-antigen ligase family protein [Bacillus cereus]|uniref:O-antigen ligase family protein n=1 Tax=Bacillus cereus TaxID=1396 RepID=UPI00190D6EB3|nr:O-antigen ligase family protein [Bacillus cereus]MBK4741589.1 O-antigen ligase family protein [Bacillus cereus]
MINKLIYSNGKQRIYGLEFILIIIFLITVFADMSEEGIYYSKFLIIMMISLVYFVKNKSISFVKNIYIFYLFLILAGASGLYGFRNDVTIGNLLTLTCCLMLVIVLPLILSTKERLYIFMSWFIIFGLILSVYVISLTDYNRLLEGRYYASEVLEESIGNRNAVALLIGLAFNFGVYKVFYQRNYKHLIFALVMLTAVLLTGSRKGLLICFIPMFINIFLMGMKSNLKKNIQYFFVSLILATLLSVLFYNILFKIDILYENIGWRFESMYQEIFLHESSNEGSYHTRKNMIQYGMDYFKERPLLGHGIENFRYLYAQEVGKETYSHNNYIELLVNNGIVGLLLYYSFYISVILKANDRRRKSKSLEEKRYYLFCISLLICMFIIDWGLVSYKWYPNYILLALALKPNWKNEADVSLLK